MTAGVSLTLFTWFVGVFVFAIHPLMRKITNSYLFWILYSCLCLGLFIGFRYAHDVNWLISTWKTSYQDVESIQISKVFLLDICPASFVALHIVLLANPSRRIAQYIAPTCIFGGILTITGQITFDPNAAWSVKYLFYGFAPNQGYFLLHFLNVVSGVLVLCNTPKPQKTTYLYTTASLLIYFWYICLIIVCFGNKITDHVTGLLKDDWVNGGEYSVVSDILKINWIGCLILMATFSYGVIELLFLPQFFIQKIKYWKIDNMKAKKIIFGYYQLQRFKH